MAKHHPDLIMCRKLPGISVGRLCEKCDGKCVVCDSYVSPCTLVRICDECNYGSAQGRCVICGGAGISDAYYCRECTIQEKDRDGCPKIVNLGFLFILPFFSSFFFFFVLTPALQGAQKRIYFTKGRNMVSKNDSLQKRREPKRRKTFFRLSFSCGFDFRQITTSFSGEHKEKTWKKKQTKSTKSFFKIKLLPLWGEKKN